MTDKNLITKNANQNLYLREKKAKNVYFTSNRSDHNLIKTLVQNNGALNIPKERQIYEAIERTAKDNSAENIKFLLSIVENLQYGVRTGSHLDRFLSDSSSIANRDKKQEINWEDLLKNAIVNALNNNNSVEKPELQEKYNNLFPEKPENSSSAYTWLSCNPTIQKEQEAVKLREKILNSEELTSIPDIVQNSEITASQKIKESIKVNIDRFLASSECAISEKVQCLELLTKFMSPEYKINNQLKNHKVQILDEMLSDLMTDKQANQRKHGMCAAISNREKALSHEHKLAYVSNIIAELDNKPYMEVYDVTDPKDTDKVRVQKADIDFNTAIKMGYRIVDASVLNWMHIADTMGNGEIQVAKYTAFDDQNYGLFHDSHLILDMAPEYQPKHNMLRATIKQRDLIEKIEIEKYERQRLLDQAKSTNNDFARVNSESRSQVAATLRNTLPDNQQEKINLLVNRLLDPEQVQKGIKQKINNLKQASNQNSNPKITELEQELKVLKDNTIELHSYEDKLIPIDEPETDKQKFKNIIKAVISELPEEKLDKIADTVYNNYLTLQEFKSRKKEIEEKFSPRSQASYYENVFKLGAFERVKSEFALDDPVISSNMAEKFQVPKELRRDYQHTMLENRLKTLKSAIEQGKVQELPKIASKLEVEPAKDKVLEKLQTIDQQLTQEIPAITEAILVKVGYNSREEMLIDFIDATSQKAQEVNSLTEEDKEYIAKVKEELKQEPSKERLSEISKRFGIYDEADTARAGLFLLTKKLNKIKDPQEFQNLAKKLNLSTNYFEFQNQILALHNEAKEIADKYVKIANQIDAPTKKSYILKKLEEKNEILSREALDDLYKKFHEIDQFEEEKLRAKREKREISSKGVYVFTDKQKKTLKVIESNFAKLKNNVNKDHKLLNEVLEPQLTELYTLKGKGKGRFWAHEEGSSGLSSEQETRIIKQMTGVDHHIENDVKKAFDHIEQGLGGSISNSFVSPTRISGHAQYVKDIVKRPLINSFAC